MIQIKEFSYWASENGQPEETSVFTLNEGRNIWEVQPLIAAAIMAAFSTRGCDFADVLIDQKKVAHLSGSFPVGAVSSTGEEDVVSWCDRVFEIYEKIKEF